MKELTNKLRCIFSRLTKLEQRTFEQVNADWNAASGAAEILNKPDLSLKADLVGGVVPSSQLPSYVDDILEFADLASLPVIGESSKIYVTLDDNKLYRWSGSMYIELGAANPVLPAYKVVSGLIFQTGANDPVLTIYENTLGGNVTAIRNQAGVYTINIDTGSASGKVFFDLYTHNRSILPPRSIYTNSVYTNSNSTTATIHTANSSNAFTDGFLVAMGTGQDGLPFEFKVYN